MGITIQTGTALLRLLPLGIGPALGLFTTAHLEGGLVALPFILFVVGEALLRRARGRPLARTRLGAALWVLLAINVLLPVVRIALYLVQGVTVPSGVAAGVVTVSYLLHLGTGYAILGLGAVLLARALWQARAADGGVRRLLDRVARSAALTTAFCVIAGGLYFALLVPEQRRIAAAVGSPADHAPSPARVADGQTWPLFDPLGEPLGCGSLECHANIYTQWAGSAHARSATNPAYTAVVAAFAEERGAGATAVCAGCHDPAHLLSGQLAERGEATGPLSEQGVSCLICHRIVPDVDEDGAPTGNGSYSFPPPARFPFEVTTSDQLTELRRTLAPGEVPDIEGLSWAAHVTQPYIYSHGRLHRGLWQLSRPGDALCGACHQAAFTAEMTGWTHVSLHGTWQEWRQSPYAEGHAGFEQQECADCHLPPLAWDAAPFVDADTEDRTQLATHAMAGANTALYATRSAEVDRAAAMAATDQLLSAVELEARRDGDALTVTITNVGAGHRFPTGARDLDSLWLEVTTGEQTLRQPVLARRLVGADGAVLPHHQIWKAAKEGEAGIPAGEARSWTIALGAEHPAPITVALKHQAWRPDFAAHVGAEAPPVTVLATVSP